ncbi:MAG: hypothetical protein D6800_10735 [Candidatus Zixiibacteriota bacterium]|nr:MAG: hypothetical protein D6800_10735 [candidate division Zixibacteria bacterium]
MIANDRLYYTNASGETFVFQLGDTVKLISTNRTTNRQESFGGTPAISMGRIFIRSNQYLYCIGDSK